MHQAEPAPLAPKPPAHAQAPRHAGSNAAWRRLRDEATAPYRAAGRFAWHFARGKLGRDPVFRGMLERGDLQGQRVVDIGCGQGLLLSLLQRCMQWQQQGQWPADWPPVPAITAYTGIELMARDVQRADAAVGALVLGAAGGAATSAAISVEAITDASAGAMTDAVTDAVADAMTDARPQFICGDMCSTPLPACDLVVILDVLHYVDLGAQDEVLRRVHAALQPRGRLLLRVGDRASAGGFRVSQWVDIAVTWVRGHRAPPTWGRSVAQWTSALQALGFHVHAVPMSAGTPFANVLLVADLP